MFPLHSRRAFLKSSALSASALALPWWACTPAKLGPDFSVAFMTDMHVDERRHAQEGFRTALNNMQALPHKPSFLINGGDLAYDILAKNREQADAQYHLFDGALSEIKIPVHNVMGNHDVLGVYEKSGMTPGDDLYGKEYFLQRFKRDSTYTSFDHEGWHFVLLDTIGIDGRTYHGYIDEEQLDWLDEDLARANKPTVIAGHIPLFSSYAELLEGIEKPDHPKAVVNNVNDVASVLLKHPGVKLVLAGHLHINETWHYKGIEFANIGAVSGRWWRGPRDGFEEGYALLSFKGEEVGWGYVDYGWDVPPDVDTEG